ncbi:hypothetical protein CMI37_05750 [Candidatus Pacearchaeota archaeon]|nr:hypothetical protein [Candidatus Pacearchaeota archaeon]
MILGLDISTSITGASILDRNGDLIYCKAWRTDKKGLSFYQKLDILKENICYIKSQYPVEKVYVEEPLKMFMAGRSSAQVVSLIQRFNGAACWILKEIFNMEPIYINASTARKKNGIKIRRGEKAKKQVLQHILSSEKTFIVEYTKRGNAIKGTYDRADSLVIAKAGYYLFEEEKHNKELNNEAH